MTEQKNVRVRFAPSPTGHLHIGSLRAALFNFLFARHNGGAFLLRIEDTDLVRSKPEYTESILNGLSWAGIESDEPIVFQAQRISEHQKLIQILLAENKAYKCYCPNRDAENSTEFYKYDGRCRDVKHDVADNVPYVVRIKLPSDVESISFEDMIRGTVTVSLQELDDFIIARSDGTPIYNFVVVADDSTMEITHVIRGEDHISNTPKQIVLYQALNYPLPRFAHLPLILGPSGQKLSKRDAATSVFEYKQEGYLSDALCNYLVRLGWAHGDQEMFTRQQMIDLFTLEAVGKKGSMFDQEKLNWFNNMYIRQTDSYKLLEIMCADVKPNFMSQVSQWSTEKIVLFIDIYKERISTLQELASILIGLYDDSNVISLDEKQQWLSIESVQLLAQLVDKLKTVEPFNVELLTDVIKKFCAEKNCKLPVIAQPIRLALTGSTKSPGIFQLLEAFGKEQALQRLQKLITNNS
jgi:glutamyl-tRNA synthetase